jgi:hypothetical protein
MTAKYALALVAMAALEAPAAQQQYPGWIMDNVRQGFDQARRTGKPLFITFR